MIETEATIEQSNNYSAQLSEIKNYFADKSYDWLMNNHSERIKELNKVQNIKEYLYDFILIVLGIKTSIGNNNGGYQARLHIKEKLDSVDTGQAIKILIQQQSLPWCCGIQEWGNFYFQNVDNKDPLLYNLLIDWIRIESNKLLANDMGAYSIINYFRSTPFTEMLEKRDDITFIKEFTNPKTKATLKTFIFDNKINI